MNRLLGFLLILVSFSSLYSIERENTRWLVGAGIGYGGFAGGVDSIDIPIGGELKLEIPAYASFRLFNFIPGFGGELAVGFDNAFYGQIAMYSRIKIAKPFIFKLGLGGGLNLDEGAGWYAAGVTGFDLYFTKTIGFETRVTIPLNTNISEFYRINALFIYSGQLDI